MFVFQTAVLKQDIYENLQTLITGKVAVVKMLSHRISWKKHVKILHRWVKKTEVTSEEP